MGCDNIVRGDIPSSVTEIGVSAFSGCTKLKSITILSNVNTIGDFAFYNCAALTTINIKKPENSITGSPWSAPNANLVINWNYSGT